MALHFYSFICMQENNCALSNLMMNDDSFSVNVWKLLSSGLNFSVFPFFVSEMSSKKKKKEPCFLLTPLHFSSPWFCCWFTPFIYPALLVWPFCVDLHQPCVIMAENKPLLVRPHQSRWIHRKGRQHLHMQSHWPAPVRFVERTGVKPGGWGGDCSSRDLLKEKS